MKNFLLVLLLFAVASCQKTTPSITPIKPTCGGELFGYGTERKPPAPPGKNKPKPPQDTTITTPPTNPPTDTTYYPPANNNAVVCYLDTSGYDNKSPYWPDITYAAPPTTTLNMAGILEILNRNYAGFNVRFVTTESEYLSADRYRRVRVVLTSSSFRTGSGYAYVGSAFWGDETPAFVFAGNLQNYTYYIGEITGHEVGHTLGLVHYKGWYADCSVWENYMPYYVMGNPTQGGQAKWAPGHPCRYQGRAGTSGKSDGEVLHENCD